MTVIQTALETSSATPFLAPSDISMSSSTVQQQANAIQSDPVQLEILKLLQQMQQTMTAPNLQTNNGGYNNNGKRGRRQPRKSPDNASYNRNVTPTIKIFFIVRFRLYYSHQNVFCLLVFT